MKITTTKIAELAGTSRGAVDKTIHGRPGVRDEVRQRILQVIEQTGYVPPKERRPLPRPRATKRVAVVLPRLTNPYFVVLERNMEQIARTLPGLLLEFYHCDTTDIGGMAAVLTRLKQRGVDACLFRGVRSTRVREALDALGKPVIFMDSEVPGAQRLCMVGEDCRKSGRIAASLLAKSIGYAGQVAVITGMPEVSSHEQRLEGFLDVIRSDYPEIEVVERLYVQDQSAIAYDRTCRLLAEYSALRGICNLAGCSGEVGQAILENRRRRAVCLVCYNTAGDVAALIRKGIVTFSISIRPREQARILLETIHAYLYEDRPPAESWLKVPISIALDENIDSLTEDFGELAFCSEIAR